MKFSLPICLTATICRAVIVRVGVMTRHQNLAVVWEWPRLLHRLITRVVVDVVQTRCLLRCATGWIAGIVARRRINGCRKQLG